MIDVEGIVLEDWGSPSRRDCNIAAVLYNTIYTEVYIGQYNAECKDTVKCDM